MRDPVNYEPAPYTEAAILISPSPAWRKPVTWNIPEWLYVGNPNDDLGVALLVKHAKRAILGGGSVTAPRNAPIDPYDQLFARVYRPEGMRWKALARTPLA